MIKNNNTLSSSLTLQVGPGSTEDLGIGIAGVPAPAGYSDVYNNEGFDKVSWHCPTANITVYISNALMPPQSPDSDVDWFEAGSGKFVHVEYPFSWFRVKGVSDANIVYVQRYSQKM